MRAVMRRSLWDQLVPCVVAVRAGVHWRRQTLGSELFRVAGCLR